MVVPDTLYCPLTLSNVPSFLIQSLYRAYLNSCNWYPFRNGFTLCPFWILQPLGSLQLLITGLSFMNLRNHELIIGSFLGLSYPVPFDLTF